MTTVSKQELASFFHDLNFRFDTVAKLNLHLANRFSVFLWLDPDELKLSSMFRELLDPGGVHGQGDAFLRSFLDMISRMAGLSRLVIDRSAPRPKCEEFTSYGRRIDIVVRPSGQCAIGIENKPWAADQPGWVKDYSDHLAKPGYSYVLVYLTADGSDPSGDDDRKAAGDLGCRFLKISYKQHIKGWLEDCRQVCRADKVRTFLKDFIDYVNVMKETGMLTEQDRTLTVDYICDNPGDRLKIAYSVTCTWRDVQRRIVKDFQTALVKRLTADLGDAWPVTFVPEEQLLDRWNVLRSVFKISKREWGDRFAFALCFDRPGCVDLIFGVCRSAESAPHIRDLKSKMDKAMGVAGQDDPYWEWELPVDSQYKNWNTPESLEKLADKNEALDYFAHRFLEMKKVAESIIDDECRPTQPDA
jgi:hypothetical protein